MGGILHAILRSRISQPEAHMFICASFVMPIKVLFIDNLFYSCSFFNTFLLNNIVISVQQYLLSAYVPNTVVHLGDTAEIKTDKIPTLTELTFYLGCMFYILIVELFN